jgi:hypothetical protein
MPAFKSSSDPEFSARSVLDRETDVGFNIDYDAQVANQPEHVAEFEAYQARSDIESRRSILTREQAQPGSINWRAQQEDGVLVDQHEVNDPNPYAQPGPTAPPATGE